MSEVMHIDGAQGEGGGQILRSSMALAALTGRMLQITSIRAKRKKPGLLRQHLTAVRAVAEICGGELKGDELGSQNLFFRPGVLRHGDYHFAVGSAGSATLVFQSVLWPLVQIEGHSRIVFEGGTHNPNAPTFDYLQRVLLPVLRSMGVGVELTLERAGFYPAGGGRMIAQIYGPTSWRSRRLDRAGSVRRHWVEAVIADLPKRIAQTELGWVCRAMNWRRDEAVLREMPGCGPGNVLFAQVDYEYATAMVTAFGRRGLSREDVARQLVRELERQELCSAPVPVDEHLADQLIMPFALAKDSSFVTRLPTLHTKTNIDIVSRFLDVNIQLLPDASDAEVFQICFS